jgi:hypothetical protein
MIVFIFSAAMAWVEAALVVDLRTLVDRLEPHQSNPLPYMPKLGEVELIREIATLIMLLTVGWLAGNTGQKRWGYALLAFGIWDILYYGFLKIIVDWPRTVWDWDILFLLPLPWWGPVLAPMSIAALMIIFGTLVTQLDPSPWPSRRAWIYNWSGNVLALIIFMSDALRVVGAGIDAIRNVLPAWFNWPLFIVALMMIAAPIIDMIRQIRITRKKPAAVSVAAGKVHFGFQTFFWLLLYKIISRDA